MTTFFFKVQKGTDLSNSLNVDLLTGFTEPLSVNNFALAAAYVSLQQFRKWGIGLGIDKDLTVTSIRLFDIAKSTEFYSNLNPRIIQCGKPKQMATSAGFSMLLQSQIYIYKGNQPLATDGDVLS